MTTYTVDEVPSGVRTLNDLLSIICDAQFELGRGERDDRIDSLLWIARDLCQGIVDRQDKDNAERAKKRIGAAE